MEKKYEMTNETIEVCGHILHRIRACRNIKFSDGTGVKQGDLGGFIEVEDNLSHEGNAWVADNAKVYGNAKVFDNALVFSNANVYGNAKVYGAAKVYGNTEVYGNAWIYGNAQVSDGWIW